MKYVVKVAKSFFFKKLKKRLRELQKINFRSELQAPVLLLSGDISAYREPKCVTPISNEQFAQEHFIPINALQSNAGLLRLFIVNNHRLQIRLDFRHHRCGRRWYQCKRQQSRSRHHRSTSCLEVPKFSSALVDFHSNSAIIYVFNSSSFM